MFELHTGAVHRAALGPALQHCSLATPELIDYLPTYF